MRTYKIYDRATGFYIGTIEVYPDEVRKLEKEFILR